MKIMYKMIITKFIARFLAKPLQNIKPEDFSFEDSGKLPDNMHTEICNNNDNNNNNNNNNKIIINNNIIIIYNNNDNNNNNNDNDLIYKLFTIIIILYTPKIIKITAIARQQLYYGRLLNFSVINKSITKDMLYRGRGETTLIISRHQHRAKREQTFHTITAINKSLVILSHCQTDLCSIINIMIFGQEVEVTNRYIHNFEELIVGCTSRFYILFVAYVKELLYKSMDVFVSICLYV
ncbi:hypothetical protein AGLY_001860 [Aphis glycines]|uniref:Uncharacterized protein n=1 Tax=Aphis glycines TaxID=307491 RepID=A0A6G0U6H2_APHGL|nr:hypothetical protein AGLY_001860 [Aphis glycines]